MEKIVHAVIDVARQSLDLYVEVSIYLIFGFFLAGVLHLIFPREVVARHLGKRSATSVLKASLFGIPLPLCSCGVIPLALSLRRHGASRGATLAFMISTPQTGVDSIMITGGLFGPLFALLRPIFSMITATVTGLVSNLVTHNDEPELRTTADPDDCPACPAATLPAKIVDMFRYAYVDLLGSIYKWLIIGLILAGVIGKLIPGDSLKGELGEGIVGKLIMVAVGIPMYICATASTPLAFALVEKGLTMGGAFVFLMAGPATNTATIAVVARYLGKRSVVIYLATIAAVSVLSGVAIDAIMPAGGHPPAGGPVHVHGGHTQLQIAGAAVMAGLILHLMIRGAADRFRRRASSTRSGRAEAAARGDTLTLHVDGMTCMHCKGTVERVVGALPGVGSVMVDLDAGTALIRSKGTLPPVETIKKVIEAEGYEVVG